MSLLLYPAKDGTEEMLSCVYNNDVPRFVRMKIFLVSITQCFTSLLPGFFYFFHGSKQWEFDPTAKKVIREIKSNSWFNC